MARTRRASIGVAIVRDPITPLLEIEAGTVQPIQSIVDNQHVPDWSVTPLVLTPVLSAIDPDGELGGTTPAFEPGTKWEVLCDGDTTVLDYTDTDFEIDSATYKLKWKANLDAGLSVTFRFTWVMMVGGKPYTAIATYTARCLNSSRKIPRLELDKPLTQKYCFCREDSDIEVNASLTGGEYTYRCTGANPTCAFLWFRKNAAGNWERLFPDSDARHRVTDYDVELDENDSSKIIIHRGMMGNAISLMCRAWYKENGVVYGGGIALDSSYRADGTLDLASPIGDSPASYYATERFLGKTVEDILDIRGTYTDENMTLNPKAYIADQRGELQDVEKHLRVRWNAVSKGARTQLAEGVAPSIKLKDVAGKDLEFTADDRGSLKSLSYGGKILTYGGKILLTK